MKNTRMSRQDSKHRGCMHAHIGIVVRTYVNKRKEEANSAMRQANMNQT